MQRSVLHFAEFALDLRSYELRKYGSVVKLERLPTELLILPAENRGELVSREQIIQRLWGDDVFVDTRQGINTAVRKIRMALQDDPDQARLLQTVPGRGYRLMMPEAGEPEKDPETPEAPVPCPPVSALPAAARGAALGWRRVAAIAGVTVAAGLLGWAALASSMRGSGRAALEERVTSNSPEAPVRAAVVSPDGKYVAYADPTGMYLRQISSGETRPWPVPRGFEAWPNSWFPDGVHLLVTRFEGPERSRSLWTVSLLGGSPQKIAGSATGGVVSPDGMRIAYLPGPEFGRELWLMDASGANGRKIAAPDAADQMYARGSWIAAVAWSPNGRRLAYIERHGTTAPDPAEDAFSLRTRDGNGGDLQVLLSDPQLGEALWWGADGRILFSHRQDPRSERTDQGVYAVRVREETGRASDGPSLVTGGRGSVGGLSGTADGKQMVLWRVNTQFQVFIAEFEAGTRRFRSPRRLTLDANGNVGEAWAPDSRAIFFVSNRNGTWKLFRQGIDETTAEVLVEGRSLYLPRLSADGSEVLYLTATLPDDGSHSVSLMRRSLAGGAPQVVLREEGVVNFQCARMPSRLCVLSKIVKGSHIFQSFDSEHGEGRELTRLAGPFSDWNWTLSPDGRMLAMFLDRHRVRFLSVESGAVRDMTIATWPIFNGDWAADGKSVFMQSVTPDNRPVILDVNEDGRTQVAIEGEASTRFAWLLQSGDLRYGLLEELVPGENDVWRVETF